MDGLLLIHAGHRHRHLHHPRSDAVEPLHLVAEHFPGKDSEVCDYRRRVEDGVLAACGRLKIEN